MKKREPFRVELRKSLISNWRIPKRFGFLLNRQGGRKKGHPIRLTTNEWYKANQLGDSYWLYVVWDPLDTPDSEPIRIQNPAKKLDHAKKKIVTARFFEIPAHAIMQIQ